MKVKGVLIVALALLVLSLGTLGAQGVEEYMEDHPELAAQEVVAEPVEVSEYTSIEDGIVWMREEEKLARDVYLALYEKWGIRTFANIARSEQQHMDAVAALLATKGIADPIASAAPGEFMDPEIQELYDELVEKGSVSAMEALTVGAIIEDLDIYDLKRFMSATDDELVLRVYGALLQGSENHMRSFAGQLARFGQPYEAQYISPDELKDILGQ